MGFFNRKQKILFLIITILAMGGFFILHNQTLAQTSYSIGEIGGTIGLSSMNLKEIVINIIKWVLGIVSLVAVSFLIYGGILWMTSKGNEEKIAKAKKVIVNTVIGIVIILLSWAIVLFVEGFVTNSSGGGGISCTTGTPHPSDGCLICNASGDGYDFDLTIPGCTFAGQSFHLNEVQTSNDGSEVYMCSRIQPIFNNNVEKTTVDGAVSSGTLYIEDDLGVVKEGTWITSGKSITFKHPKVCSNDNTQSCMDDGECGGASDTCDLMVFKADTDYNLYLPETINDKDTLSLDIAGSAFIGPTVNCNADAPNNRVVCSFRTNNIMDTTPPEVTTTYPIHTGDTGYPDTNVNREPIIDINFSENIDASTVIDSVNPPQPNSNNIQLQKIDSQGGTPQFDDKLDTDADTYIDANFLEISEKSNGFHLSLIAPNNLEPFTWYRVTVQDVEDLCGNVMVSMPVLEFQTNDKVAGFNSWYPTGSNVCPDTKIIVTFNTSMYFNEVSFTVNGNQVIMPAADTISPPYTRTAPSGFGTLEITDPGAPSSNHFKVFELTPATPLTPGTNYSITVRTDRVIDSSGGFLEGIPLWDFDVTAPEDCTCGPFITGLDPNKGGPGECITIHGQCLKKTTGLIANPTAVNFDTTSASLEASGENHIVTTSPATFSSGDRPEVTVDLTYDDATYGTLTSKGVEFYYNTNDLANGPCLFSISGSCYPSSNLTLEGIRFEDGASTSTKDVEFQAVPSYPYVDSINAGDWTDTKIQSQVPPKPPADETTDGNVYVTNDTGSSNSIDFNICELPPGVPIVTNYWPDCGTACINTVPETNFNIAMDSSTINNTNITLEEHDAAACDSTTLDGPVSITPTYNTSEKKAILTPDSYLNPDTYYRVILNNNIVSDSDSEPLANINYDADEDGTDDSFSWTFKTKDDPTACSIASADLTPKDPTITVGNTEDYEAFAYGSPDECNPATGQMLIANSYDWAWKVSHRKNPMVSPPIDDPYGTFTNYDKNSDGRTDPKQTFTAHYITPPPPYYPSDEPEVTVTASAVSRKEKFTIINDPTICVTDEDCENLITEDGTEISCPGSTCINNHCSPVINDFSPKDGAIGTWVSIAGCWFGNYDSSLSKVIFQTDKEALKPNESICGDTWKNYLILREVPNSKTADLSDDADSGDHPFRVRGGDLASGYSYSIESSDFTTAPYVLTDGYFEVNSTVRPGICALNPNLGKENITDVEIKGKNFGSSRDALPIDEDRVTFHDGVDVTNYVSWANDTMVETTVPLGAETGNIQLFNDGVASNTWPFTVRPPSCDICNNDGDCPVGQGCGDDGCCYDRPSVSSTIPTDGEPNVCLNNLIEVNFDQNMDQSTLNDSNITLTGGVASYTISSYDDRVRINLNDLLKGSTTYTVNLTNDIENTKGVSMVADSFSFTTADTNDPCEIDYIDLNPSHHMFTSKTETRDFTASAYDDNDNSIQSILGVYDWAWHWSMDNKDIATVNNDLKCNGGTYDGDSCVNNDDCPDGICTANPIQTASPVKNGQTWLRSEAQAGTGWTGSKKASAEIEVIFCDMPWEFEEAASNCDINADGCSNDYNFKLFYCRGDYGVCEGTTNTVCTLDYQTSCPTDEECCSDYVGQKCQFSSNILPDLDMSVVRGESGDVLKQYLFKESGRCSEGHQRCSKDPSSPLNCTSGTCEVTDDGIGIRIYANPEALTPQEWYKQNIKDQGSPQSTTVDGYRAVRDGRTVYVGATNYDSGTLYSNIYLISYNKGADSKIKNIYDQLIDYWTFNTNITTAGEKEKIIRDLKRIADLRTITGYLEDYRANQPSSSETNLVNSPGFEDVYTIVSSTDEQVWETPGSFSSEVNVDSSQAHTGNNSVELKGGTYDSSDLAASRRYVLQDVPVTYGKTYKLTAWVKTDDHDDTDDNDDTGDLGFEIHSECLITSIHSFDWTGCDLNSHTDYIYGDNDWTKITNIVYANKADRSIRFIARHRGVVESNDVAWVDDFKIEEIEAPYPMLESGSYISNMSTSIWPSWQASLGNALGKSLPVDPLNEAICPSFPPNTCWDEENKEFLCSSGSSIYAYQTDHGVNYNLYVNLETDNTYWDASTSEFDICDSISSASCDSFDYWVSSP
ncbi:MAG: Ig-like domain-containing protein [Patescibacteria group bacterium]|nr:Ig-like domain-containing protein [Patescibacteria group bacterium]